MHVTLVSGIDPASGAGGTRSYVLGLAKRLRERDISVAVVARNGGSVPIPGVEHVPVRTGPSSVRFLLRLLAAAPKLPIPNDSIIHVQRPDDLVAFSRRRGNPKVCTLHGIAASAVRRRKGAGYGFLYRQLERVGLRRVDRAIAVNEGTARWYAARYPWLAERMAVIPVAVDTERFRPLDREAARKRFGVTAPRAVLFAGRLSVEKRVDAVIAALRHVPRAEFLIAGEGPEEGRLRTLAQGLPVRFLGAVPHEDMPHLMNAVDLLVLPSEYEGLATVALEALACGTPVVATPVGGLPDVIVPGETGWFVSDASAMGQVLAEALPKAAAFRDHCVAAAKPYAWDVVVERILAVYREVAT